MIIQGENQVSRVGCSVEDVMCPHKKSVVDRLLSEFPSANHEEHEEAPRKKTDQGNEFHFLDALRLLRGSIKSMCYKKR
jgi:hypothetical protein